MLAAVASGATETTWTGSGGDKLTSTAANWSQEVDLSDGSAVARFASGGSEALASGSLSLYGIVFGSTGPFTLGAVDARAAITLGAGGIATSGTGPYTLSVPLEIAADQTWAVGVQTLISAPVAAASSSAYTVTKTGAGTLDISAQSTFSGNVEVKSGGLVLHGTNPLGNGDITVCEKSSLTLKGANIDNAVTVDPQGGWSEDTKIHMPVGHGDSRINGKVTVRYGNVYTVVDSSPDYRNKLVFAGGFECSGGQASNGSEVPAGGYAYFNLNGGGAENTGCAAVEFTENPVMLGGTRSLYVKPSSVNRDGFAGEFIFSVPGNEINSFGHYAGVNSDFRLRSCKVQTTVDGAFDNPSMTVLCDYNMEWDLCGTEQQVGFIKSAHSNHRAPVILNSHERAATLRFNHVTSDWTNKVVFAGNLNVVMSGTKKLEIESAMTASGDLTVTGGTLAFTGNGAWRNARTVSVSGSGRITAVSGDTFPESVTLSLASADSFAVAPGENGTVVTQTVSHLFVAGERREHGCYSAGGGVLSVLYDRSAEIVDGALVVGAGESFALDRYVQCDAFDTIVLGDGASLEIAERSCILDDVAYRLVIGEGAVLKLAEGIGLLAESVTCGDEVLSPGRYDDASWLQGGAGVYIPYGESSGTDVRWTGLGGDTLMSTAENWERPVNLSDASVRAVFADGGSAATVSGEVNLNAMVFNAGVDFTVGASGEGALIRLGSGGVGTTGEKTHTVSVPVKVEADQEWNIQAPFHAVISSDPLSRYVLSKSGTNALYIHDGGRYSGSIDVSGGGLVVYGKDALGAGGKITLANANILTVSGAVVDKPVTFSGAPAGEWNDETGYTVWGDGGDTLQNGKVEFGQGNFYVRMYCNQNYRSTVVFAGGLESETGYPYFDLTGGGSDATGFCTVVFTNKPVAVSRAFSLMPHSPNRDGYSARICFSVPGNEMASLGHAAYAMKSCQMWTTVDRAFDNPSMKVICDGDFRWDLRGTVQRVGHLDAKHSQNRAPVITNSFERIARLYLNQTDDSAPRAVFGGNLSVDISGGRTTTVDHVMTATGELTVNGGTLAFTAEGSWSKASAVVVNGDAKLTLADPRNLGRKTRLVLASESSLEIAAGASVRVASLCVGGVERNIGRYRFGDGELVVGPQGFKMIVR